MSKYDLAVAYRIYPGVSKNPILFPHDKLGLANTCLSSFRQSLGALKVKMFVLLDQCPREYETMFGKYFNPEDLELIPLPKTGNRGTFGMQIDVLLRQQEADLVYFAEDDYYYLPGQFPRMVKFLLANPDADFVVPFNHPDYYSSELHDTRPDLRTFGQDQWRTANSACLTFLTAKETLRKTESVFRSYTHGNSDAGLWLSLTKRKIFDMAAVIRSLLSDRITARAVLRSWLHNGKQVVFGSTWTLWSPIPTIATAVERSCLAPGFDWESIMLRGHEGSPL